MKRSHLPLVIAGVFAVILLTVLAVFISRSQPVPPSKKELAENVAQGQLYERGTGVTLDYAQALGFYRKAADAGYPPAEVAMGRMTAAGRGIVRDDKAASAWFRRAAEQGNAEGQVMLAQDYLSGVATTDGKPDKIEALKWLQLGAGKLTDAAARTAALATQAQLAAEMSDKDRAESTKRANKWREDFANK